MREERKSAADLLFWTSPLRSLLALLLWNFGAHFCLEHYPALAPLLLLGYMLRHRGRSEALEAPVRKHSAPALLDGAELSRQAGKRGTADSTESHGFSTISPCFSDVFPCFFPCFFKVFQGFVLHLDLWTSP